MKVKTLYKIQENIEQTDEIKYIIKKAAKELFTLIPKENVNGYDIRTFGSLLNEYFKSSFDLEFMTLYMDEADKIGYED